jgi:hypothetical protein
MKYTIITYIPSIPEKVALDETEADTIEEVISGLHVPLDGYCLIINQDDVTKVTSKVINIREENHESMAS